MNTKNDISESAEAAYLVKSDPDDFSTYETLVGPDGFICTLTEPEDRCWGRDLAPVITRLNDTASRLQRCEEALKFAEIALCLVPAKGMDNYFMRELQSSQITPALAKVRAALTHPTPASK